ncbi:FG-GAP-like repeat-containing protein [Polaromonas sp. A23]|uniref:FG-GAP-like repeat-containing protein n=1 Tax=Polaromonas sp. A23 TaxID=1944133 RepID=UPI0009867D5E|nr:FG-GAP-like repeat-containing protein [Polaromonas sp. A23]OOG39664.1 hypothetical protein B0B52_13555 [Polaromonas sp. A23]
MRHLYKQALLGAVLCAAACGTSFAQTTVAGTTPGQFSVNESGAATYSIPIQVPPGVAGMQPQLSLEYNSQSGNGLLGMGWSLSGLSAITRCPRTMAQDGVRGGVGYDMNDRFCLDGQRLILVSGTYGAANSEYRTERESFSKITAYGSAGNGPAYFTMQTKAGLTMELGNTADSKIEAQGKPTVRVWALNRVQDVKSNFMTFSYAEDSANGDFYPLRIDYAGNASIGQVPANSVQLVPTATARLDVQTAYQAGALIKTSKRLGNIQTYTGTTLVSDYRLEYLVQASAVERSKIASVVGCDSVGDCLPATRLEWTSESGASYVQGNYQAPGNALVWQNGYCQTFVVDVDGDGRADLVQVANATYDAQVLLSDGNGSFVRAWQSASNVGPFWRASYGATIPVDVNGDGRTDFIQIANAYAQAQVLIAQPDGSYVQGSYQAPGTGPDWSPAGPMWSIGFASTFIADVNGDGLADVVQVVNATYDAQVLLSNGNGSFVRAWQSASNVGPFWRASYGATIPVDVNGDGRTDFVQIADAYEQAQVLIAQPDGSYVQGSYQAPTALPFWRNNYARTFSGNFRGLEKADLVQIANDYSQAQTLFAGTLSVQSDLVRSTVNGGGASFAPNYAPLTNSAIYTKDSGPNAAVYPKVDLQYPQYVVSTVSTSNGVGGVNTVEYSYGGLKAEQGTGRGSLGFRWMKSKSVANNIESYTEFNQNHPFTGTVAKNETRLAGSGNAGLLKRTTNTYAQSPGSAGASVFVYPSQSVEESWDLSGTPYPSSSTSYVYGQNPQYGDPTQITVSNSEGSSKTTVNEYWPANTGSGNWILGRLKKASVTSVKP